MNNKVLVHLFVPELDTNFDLFIPVNEIIWKIKKLIVKSVSDLVNVPLSIEEEYILINKDNARVYQNNEIVIETDIRNVTELILLSKK